MSVNFNRAQGKNYFTSKEYKYFLCLYEEPYSEDYWGIHYTYDYKSKLGYKKPNKSLYFYKRRMYRTWKYNRKTQYKIK